MMQATKPWHGDDLAACIMIDLGLTPLACCQCWLVAKCRCSTGYVVYCSCVWSNDLRIAQ